MSRQITTVTYLNFGPFLEATCNFAREGLTVIEGQSSLPGCDSNGAGKSFLFDGVSWCAFGRCVRPDYKGDDVIHLGQKWCAVIVAFEGDGPSIRIERYRNHPDHASKVRLFIGGKNRTRGTNAQTELVIITALGLDYTAFANSVAFGTREDVKSFFAATDTERKAILERLLGLERYAAAEKVARARSKKLAGELEGDEDRLTMLAAQIEGSRTTLDSLRESLDPDALQTKLNDALNDLDDAEARSEQSGNLWERATKLHEQAEAILVVKESVFQEERADFDEAWEAADGAHSEALQEASTVRGSKRVLATQRDDLSELSGAECPTCKQEVPKQYVSTALAKLAGEISKLSAGVATATGKAELHKQDRDSIKPPSRPDDKIEIRAAGYVKRCKTMVTAIGVDIQRHTEAIAYWKAQLAKASGQIVKAEKSVADKTTAHAELSKAIAPKQRQLHLLGFWIEGFGNKGLKSFLIEAEIPAINRLALTYACQLLGEGATVKLSATTLLKSGASREKLSVEGSIPGCTKTYRGASSGQKKRMDLALLLAFRDLVARRAARSLRQLFADELFDGLDRTGVEYVTEMLRGVAKDCPVALVTHDDRLKHIGDSLLTVKHDGEQAILVGTGVKNKKAKRKGPSRKKR